MFDLIKPPGLGRRVLICALGHGAGWLNDVVDLLVDNQSAMPAPLFTAPSSAPVCDDCGFPHEPLAPSEPPGSPESRLLAAMGLGPRSKPEAAVEPVPADDLAWAPVFADEVRPEQLIALPEAEFRGWPRPLRVVRVRRREPEYGFGQPVVVLALVDESGSPRWVNLSPDFGLQVAVSVPDSVPADLDGGR